MRFLLLAILCTLSLSAVSHAQFNPVVVTQDPPDDHIWVVKKSPMASGRNVWIVIAEQEPVTWWERYGDDVVKVSTGAGGVTLLGILKLLTDRILARRSSG